MDRFIFECRHVNAALNRLIQLESLSGIHSHIFLLHECIQLAIVFVQWILRANVEPQFDNGSYLCIFLFFCSDYTSLVPPSVPPVEPWTIRGGVTSEILHLIYDNDCHPLALFNVMPKLDATQRQRIVTIRPMQNEDKVDFAYFRD